MISVRSRLAAMLTLLLVMVSGCLTSSSDGWTGSDVPRVGAWAFYETSHGTTINVSILGPSVVRDSWGQPHDSWRLLYSFAPADADQDGFSVTEYVDQTTGSIIRHDIDCINQFTSKWSCDERYAHSVFAAYGLPGMLGRAAHWIAREDTGEWPRASGGFQTAILPQEDWDSPADLKVCKERLSEPLSTQARWKPFGVWPPVTAILSPLLVCSDDVFPSAFVPDMYWPLQFPADEDRMFILKDEFIGTGESIAPANGRLPTPRPMPDSLPSKPLAFLGDESPFLRTTSRQAHQVLINESPEYRSLINDEGASIVWMSHIYEGTVTEIMDQIHQVVHKWVFYVLAPNGDFQAFRVHTEVTYDSSGNELHSRTFSTDPDVNAIDPPDSLLGAPQISLADAHSLAASLWGCPKRSSGSDISYRIDQFRLGGDRTGHTEGRALLTIDRPPTFPVGGVSMPFMIRFDGLTGGIIEMIADDGLVAAYDSNGLNPVDSCP